MTTEDPMATDANSRFEARILALADRLEERKRGDEQNTEKPTVWIAFQLGTQTLALPVTHIEGVHRVARITAVPQAPPTVRGVTNIRGRVLAVLDLAARLDLGWVEIGTDSRILLTRLSGRPVGLLVDRAETVLKIPASQIGRASRDLQSSVNCATLGAAATDNGRVLLLDPVSLLADYKPTGSETGPSDNPTVASPDTSKTD